MWTCPLCGSSDEQKHGVCERCGFKEENISEGDGRPEELDLAKERKKEYKKTLEGRKGVLLMKMQSLDLTNTPLEEIKQTMAEVLTGLDVPLKIDAEFSLELDDKELEIVTVLEQITNVLSDKLVLSADNPETFVRLGNMEYGVQEFQKALDYYNNALLSHPNFRDGIYNKALSLFALHNYEESVKCLNKLLKRYPEDHDGSQLLGLVEQMVIDSANSDDQV